MLNPAFGPTPDPWAPETVRTPPANLEAEQAILGAILLENRALERIGDTLKPEHFFDPLHGEIYSILQQTIGAGRLASPITLKNTFAHFDLVGELTVPQYLGTLAAKATSIINVPDYAQTIRDLSMRRGIVIVSEDMQSAAYTSGIDVPPLSIIEDAEADLLKLVDNGPKASDEVSFATAISDAIQRANEAFRRGGGLTGLATGLTDLDGKMGGMAPSDLIIIGGRPGIGKTSLATTIAANVAIEHMKTGGKQGSPVHFFSQEMSAEQLATRILGQYAEIPSEKIRRGTLEQHHFSKLMEHGKLIQDAPFIIDQTGGLSLAQVSARARRMKRKKNTGLIVIDYLQLMYGSAKENRTQDLTRITNGLKALAKELNVPIVALSQLSRQVESREDKRPHLADLRESGSIEQDADIVIFVYREEYYVELKRPSEGDIEKTLEWEAELAKVQGKGEAIIAKHRHGPTGTVPLAFDKQFTAFGNLARERQLPERYQ